MKRMMRMTVMSLALAVMAGGVIGEALGQNVGLTPEQQEEARRLEHDRQPNAEGPQREAAGLAEHSVAGRIVTALEKVRERRDWKEARSSQATLMPGEDVELLGVKISLRLLKNRSPQRNSAMADPTRALIAFRQGDYAVAVPVDFLQHDRPVYLKEWAVRLKRYEDGMVECTASIVPADGYPIPGGPGGVGKLLVSRIQPAKLGNLSFLIQNNSEEPKLGRIMRERGLQWDEALALDPELILDLLHAPRDLNGELVITSGTQELLRMPLKQNFVREFGRFIFTVENVSLPASTIASAEIDVKYRPDQTIRGAKAWVTGLPQIQNRSLKASLDEMAARYGFQYRFVPNMPSEFTEELKVKDPPNTFNGSASEAVEVLMERTGSLIDQNGVLVLRNVELKSEWIDEEHLEVRILKPTVEEAEEYLRVRRDVERLEGQWDELVKMDMVVYPLKTISAQTALTMAEPKLHTFFINRARGKIEQAQASEEVRFAVRKKVETAVMDEKSNSLIVTATAETHAEIKALLEKLEGRIERAEGAGGQIRIQVAIIAGESGAPTTPTTQLGQYHPLDPTIKYGNSIYRYRASVPDGDQIYVNYAAHKNSGTAAEIAIPGVTREQQFDVMSASGGEDEVNIVYRLIDEKKGLRWLEEMGLSKKEVAGLGISRVDKTGRASLTVLAEPGEAGKARAVLGDYMVEVEYLASRGELVVARATLRNIGGAELFSNTIFLEPSRPFITGITTLQYSVALVMLRVE